MLLFVDFFTRLSQPNVIIGIILCAIGLGLVFLSKKFIGFYRKADDVKDNDKVFLFLKVLGLAMICSALIIMILY